MYPGALPPDPPSAPPPLLLVPLPPTTALQGVGALSPLCPPLCPNPIGAASGEHDSQAPSSGLCSPCSLLEVERKSPAKRCQAPGSKRGWLIWTEGLEIRPVGRYQPAPTSQPALLSPPCFGHQRGRGCGKQANSFFPPFRFEELRIESNAHFQLLMGREFPGEALLVFPSSLHPGQGRL